MTERIDPLLFHALSFGDTVNEVTGIRQAISAILVYFGPLPPKKKNVKAAGSMILS